MKYQMFEFTHLDGVAPESFFLHNPGILSHYKNTTSLSYSDAIRTVSSLLYLSPVLAFCCILSLLVYCMITSFQPRFQRKVLYIFPGHNYYFNCCYLI